MGTVYSVSQINLYIKNMFSNDYLLKNVQIKGELSNVKYHSSGHIYFTIKDDTSAVNGVMFKSSRLQGLDFNLENGQCVLISGNISVYERDGRYQIYARKIVLDGRGNLYEAYELLKQKLYEEGLFDFEHKKEIPRFPRKIGIVTAKTGAAIQDILNIAKRRNPYVQLYLYPAKVQGEGAAQTIKNGIEKLDTMELDTIIIGRGGGSIEDLWPFNDEMVARAIYHAKTPIISGTGHEIDTTIADYVADLRAPTPSAACELAIPDLISSLNRIHEYDDKLKQLVIYKLQNRNHVLEALTEKLNRVSPKRKLQNQKIFLDSMHERLISAMNTKNEKNNHRYEVLLAKLNGLSPTAKLVGGYGYVEKDSGLPVKSIRDISEKDTIHITIYDGKIEGIVTKIVQDEEFKNG